MLAVNAAIPICNIERDGVTRDGQRGELYGDDVDKADAGDFERRSRGNRHQFRFILSADAALELGDLAAFTRAHMKQVELDLSTRLDWVAVDHWDTDHQHTHNVLRGNAHPDTDQVTAPDQIHNATRTHSLQR